MLAAEKDTKDETNADSHSHGLEWVFADKAFRLVLAVVGAIGGIRVDRVGATACMTIGRTGGIAEIFSGGAEVLATSFISGFSLFFRSVTHRASGLGGSVDGFFCVFAAAFEFFAHDVAIKCFGHGKKLLQLHPATDLHLGKRLSGIEYEGCMTHIKAFAPGRVEILGNHTDYNGGVVLSAALQLGITATGRKLENGEIRLSSSGVVHEGKIQRSAGLKKTGEWTDYPLGVAEMLARAGAEAGGFEVSYEATLPTGAGLSSSAALEVATAVFLTRLYPFKISRLDLAKLCRRAENEFVGVNCGLLDQASSVFGKKDHLVYLDCRSESVDAVPFPAHLGLLIINSGVKHALTGGEYNERREQCFEAARCMAVPALRDVSSAQLEATEMPALAKRRARHVVGENERVFQAIEAMRSGHAEALGPLMSASHRSSIENFENSTPELDLLVSLATAQPGCLGARLTGGGFGGAIVALVKIDDAESIRLSVEQDYASQTKHKATGVLCRAGDGALPLED